MLLLQLHGLVVVFVVLVWTHCHHYCHGGLATLHISLLSLSCWHGPTVAIIIVIVLAWTCCRRCHGLAMLHISSFSLCWHRRAVIVIVMAWPHVVPSVSSSPCWHGHAVVVVVVVMSQWHLLCATCHQRLRYAVVDLLSLLPFKSSCCGGTYHACRHCRCLHRDCMDTLSLLSLLYYWRGWWVVQVVVVLVASSTRVTAGSGTQSVTR